MRRRAFLAATAAALAAPTVGRAQEMRRIAMVETVEPASVIGKSGHPYWQALFEGLEALGWKEGETLTVERYSGEGDVDRFPAIANLVVGTKPDLIYTRGHNAIWRTWMEATDEIPIVTVVGVNGASQFAESLSRPGRNITGFLVTPGPEFHGKRLQLLLELVPRARRVGYLTRRTSWNQPSLDVSAALEAAAQLGLQLAPALIDTPPGEVSYARVFDALVEGSVDALIVYNIPENQAFRSTITALAASARLPAMYPGREYPLVGGLASYGTNTSDQFRRAAGYVDKILMGGDPAEMPIQQPETFDLILNLRTARALGIEIPPKLLIQATELIE